MLLQVKALEIVIYSGKPDATDFATHVPVVRFEVLPYRRLYHRKFLLLKTSRFV